MAHLLDEMAAEAEAVMREAEGLETSVGPAAVRSILEEVWSAPPRARARRPRLALLVPFLAAAGLLGWLFVQSRQPAQPAPAPGGPSGTYLSAGDFELVHPQSTVPAWDRIEWSGPEGASYTLRVLDLENGNVLHGPETTMARRVDLPGEVTETWPSRILIEIELRDAALGSRFVQGTATRQP